MRRRLGDDTAILGEKGTGVSKNEQQKCQAIGERKRRYLLAEADIGSILAARRTGRHRRQLTTAVWRGGQSHFCNVRAIDASRSTVIEGGRGFQPSHAARLKGSRSSRQRFVHTL